MTRMSWLLPTPLWLFAGVVALLSFLLRRPVSRPRLIVEVFAVATREFREICEGSVSIGQVNDLVGRWCDRLKDGQTVTTKTEQQQPENRWCLHSEPDVGEPAPIIT